MEIKGRYVIVIVRMKMLRKGRENVLKEGNERKRRKKSERNSNSKGENPCRRVALR